jgi:hypothetical protein
MVSILEVSSPKKTLEKLVSPTNQEQQVTQK